MPFWVYNGLRTQTGTFTRFTRFTIHLEHSEKPFDMFYFIAFERFEPGSSSIRLAQTHSKEYHSCQRDIIFDMVIWYRSKWVEPGSNTCVYELRQERSRGSPFTIPIWNVYELRQEHSRAQTGAFMRFTRFTIHLEHSEKPIDWYSIAFELFCSFVC